MPYASNNGVKIYYEVEEKGPPLIMIHGLGDNLSQWRRCGHSDALKNDYQLILLDARAHGKSDKPHEPSAYGSKMAEDVLAVLNDLGIRKTHYIGYSMGATIGFRLATGHADNFLSFIFGGSSPYPPNEAAIKGREMIIEMMKLAIKDPQAYIKRREQSFGRALTPQERKDQLAGDPEAGLALMSNPDNYPTFSNHDLSLISVPCLFFCGDLDTAYTGAKEAASHIKKAKFIPLPSLNHVTAFARSDLVLPHIKEFLAQVSTK
jgi:pimeloyl-ACP methyl ester carboxylesterase